MIKASGLTEDAMNSLDRMRRVQVIAALIGRADRRAAGFKLTHYCSMPR